MSEYPKKVTLNDPTLAELIIEKNNHLTEGRALTKQIDELEQERAKIGHKIQKLKDKIIPLSQELGKPFLVDEFDDFGSIDLDENNIPFVEIFNHRTDWEEGFRKNKANNAAE